MRNSDHQEDAPHFIPLIATSLDNFTAEVCKVINGQQQDQTIGMFRLSSLDENLELDDERGTTV